MSADRYPVPRGRTRVEDEVKKSRFIATVARASTADDAHAFVTAIREEFPDATHNCWAYVVGPPGTTRDNGASDDGEPGGTAGRPMLGALLGSGVGDIAVVVTRYFGGVKLGRGGLVRAYSGAVLHALREMRRDERVTMTALTLTFPYPCVDAVRRAIDARDGRVIAETFGADVTLTVSVPECNRADLEVALGDATGGAVRVTPAATEPE